MAVYYLGARPETLVSLIRTGRMPEHASQSQAIKRLKMYSSAQGSCRELQTNINQKFIIEVDVPEDSSQIESMCSPENKTNWLETERMNTAWIKKVIIYSQRGQKLFTRLLNGENLPICEINPIFFGNQPKRQAQGGLFRPKVNLTPRPLIVRKQGDLLGSTMQTLINTVNCKGVMGKGIALAFKKQYPVMFAEYKKMCDQGKFRLGESHIYQVPLMDRKIINFPTKDDWRRKSDIKALERGLQHLVANYKDWGVTSLAVPPLGCGNGGLKWSDVSPLIDKYLLPLGIPLEIYEPFEQCQVKRKQSGSVNRGVKVLRK